MKLRLLSVYVVVSLCFCALPLESQSALDLPELVTQSAIIVRAKVTALSAQWITDKYGKHIYTTAQMEPVTALKGIAPTSLTYIGGTVDTITEVVSDMFVLKSQDEAFFFIPAEVEKFTSAKITVLNVREGIIRKYNFVIKAVAVESAIRAMIKTPSLKMKFEDLIKNEIKPIQTAPLQNKLLKLSKVTSLPDLRPYAIWNSYTYPIIVRNTPAANPYVSSETDSSPLNDNDSTLISFCIANFGSDTSGAFLVKIYFDAQLFWTEKISSLLGGYYIYFLNRYIASLPAGTHTLKMVINPDHAVIESDTGNNAYTRSITISHVSGVPFITSISPSSVSAGTNSLITITGTGLGATQNNSVVEFFYQTGQPKILAPVSSWNDKQILCTVPTGTINGYDAAASSGPLTVRTTSGVSGGYNVTVTFAYGGVKWNTSTVTYKINENYTSITGEGAAVQAAFASWNNAGGAFSFIYGGSTNDITASYNGTNAILWGTTSGSLATNYSWENTQTMALLESDIVFNNTYTWGIGLNYDIQSTATHELGHTLKLLDQYGNGDLFEIMYGYGSSGDIKRTLSTAEIAGIQWIYGALPVELASFLATVNSTDVQLVWTTATEINNYGFNVERRAIDNQQWLEVRFIAGNGTSNLPHDYSFTDSKLLPGRYAYRLKQIDINGAYKYSQSVEVEIPAPKIFALEQNFPNPFNPATTIRYALPSQSKVKIQIFNTLGQLVASLINDEQAPGERSIVWNVTVASGIYFYRMEATEVSNPNNRYVNTKKMILLK